MLKDFSLALILGALFGIGATGTYLTYQKSHSSRPASSTQASSSDTPTPSPSPSVLASTDSNHTLKLYTPLPYDLVTSPQTTFTGTTTPNSLIIIQTTNDFLQTTADGSGNFTLTATTEAGVNLYTISSIHPNHQQITSTPAIVTYSTAKI